MNSNVLGMIIKHGDWIETLNDGIVEVIQETDDGMIEARKINTLEPQLKYGELVKIKKEEIIDDEDV